MLGRLRKYERTLSSVTNRRLFSRHRSPRPYSNRTAAIKCIRAKCILLGYTSIFIMLQKLKRVEHSANGPLIPSMIAFLSNPFETTMKNYLYCTDCKSGNLEIVTS